MNSQIIRKTCIPEDCSVLWTTHISYSEYDFSLYHNKGVFFVTNKQKIYFTLKNIMIQTQQHLREVGEPQVTKLRKLWKPKKCVGVVDPSRILLTCNFCQQLTHTTALNTTLNSTRPDKRRPKSSLTKLCCWRTQSNFLCPLLKARAFIIKKDQKW